MVKPSNLRARLVLVMLAALLPVLGYSGYVALEGRNLLADRSRVDVRWMVHLLAEQQAGALRSADQILQLLAETRSIRMAQPEACADLMRRATESDPRHNAHALIALDGRPICTWPPFSGDFQEREWFQRARANDGPVLGTYQRNYVGGRSAIVIARRIPIENDQELAVLAIALDLETMVRIDGLSLPAQGSAAVIDRAGTIIAREPDPERWIGEQVGDLARFEAFMARGKGVEVFVGVDGIQRFYGFERIDLGEESAVLASVALPVASGLSLLLNLNVLLLAMLGLAALIAVWFGTDRIIARPLGQLAAVARDLREGRFESRATLSVGDDEIARLGAEFDIMAAAIGHRQRLLETAERVAGIGNWEHRLADDRLSLSAEARRILGADPASFEDLIALVHPEDRDRLRSAHAAALGDAASLNVELRLGRSDDIELQLRAAPDRDSDGTPLALTGTLQDVSELRGVQRQLVQSQRLEAVGQLTGGVAHDFNNLLTVVLGNAEILTEELGADERLRFLAEMIVSAAGRGADLTGQLLAFARKQALVPQALDINLLVQGMHGLLRRSLGEHVEIRFVHGAGLRPALVDPAQLESALLNLCLNARDAMPGGGRLTIETANIRIGREHAEQRIEVEPGDYVLLAVSDTGTGIPPEQLARVFEPFYTTKEKGKGTGLGLAMVYGFAKQSGGHVSIYSEPGQGTTVKLYLPCANGGESRSEPAAVGDAGGGGETILLVEDEPLLRQHVADQLRGLGYGVISAEHGPAALALLRERKDIDLLFTDIVMPGGLSGRELADAARALRPDLKVLYTSGYTENAIVHHGRLDPGVQLLGKPYRRAELARKVREVLDGS